MSSVVDGWRDVPDGSGARRVSSVDCGELVEVAALLRGSLMPAGIEWDRPPLALRLYLDGDVARFVFTSNDFARALWGSTHTLRAGLLDVEEALCRGHCDWRKNQWYKNGFTPHRK